MKSLNVPSAIVLGTTITSFLFALVTALVFVPHETWLLFGHGIQITPWPTVATIVTGIVVSMIAALRQAWHSPVLGASTGPQRVPPSSSTAGFASLGAMLLVVGAALLALLLHGCATSAIHTHAIAAHSAYQLVRDAAPAIVAATTAALEECPDDDGDARSSCIDRVEHVAVIAGSARDVLVPAVQGYRSATLRACDVDPSADNPPIPDDCPDNPAALGLIEAAAEPVESDLPMLLAALSALTGGR